WRQSDLSRAYPCLLPCRDTQRRSVRFTLKPQLELWIIDTHLCVPRTLLQGMCNFVGEYPEVSSPVGIPARLGEVDMIPDSDRLSATSGDEIIGGGIIVDDNAAKRGAEAAFESGSGVTVKRPSARWGRDTLLAMRTSPQRLPPRDPSLLQYIPN